MVSPIPRQHDYFDQVRATSICFVLTALETRWLMLHSPLSSSIFAPAVGNAADEFGVTSSILISLGVTAYLFGYGVSSYEIGRWLFHTANGVTVWPVVLIAPQRNVRTSNNS